MKNYFDGQMKITDRLAIEVEIEQGYSFKKMANILHRHPTTVSNEIKVNRTFIAGNYSGGNDCRKARHCEKRHLCDEEYCNKRCRVCRKHGCHEICKGYTSQKCTKYNKPPHVWNKGDGPKYFLTNRTQFLKNTIHITITYRNLKNDF